MPDTFKTIAMAVPSYWAMHGLQSVLYFGRSYEVLASDYLALLGFAALTGAIAVFLAHSAKRG